LFDDKFGRPARGNDKGNVEGMVGYTRHDFMVPAPRYDSFELYPVLQWSLIYSASNQSMGTKI
jgi:transposase